MLSITTFCPDLSCSADDRVSADVSSIVGGRSAAQEGGCRLIFTHVFDDRGLAAQTAAGWETYLSRLEPHLAGGHLSEEEAHEPWGEVHERFGVVPAPGRRFLATQRAGQ